MLLICVFQVLLSLLVAAATTTPINIRYFSDHSLERGPFSYHKKGTLTKLRPIKLIDSDEDGQYGNHEQYRSKSSYRPSYVLAYPHTKSKSYRRPSYSRRPSYKSRPVYKSRGVRPNPNLSYRYAPSYCAPGQVRNANGQCITPSYYRNNIPPAVYISSEEADTSGEDIGKIFVRLSNTFSNNQPNQTPVIYLLKENGGRSSNEYGRGKTERPKVFLINYNRGENINLPGGVDLRTALDSSVSVDDIVSGFGQAENSGNQIVEALPLDITQEQRMVAVQEAIQESSLIDPTVDAIVETVDPVAVSQVDTVSVKAEVPIVQSAPVGKSLFSVVETVAPVAIDQVNPVAVKVEVPIAQTSPVGKSLFSDVETVAPVTIDRVNPVAVKEEVPIVQSISVGKSLLSDVDTLGVESEVAEQEATESEVSEVNAENVEAEFELQETEIAEPEIEVRAEEIAETEIEEAEIAETEVAETEIAEIEEAEAEIVDYEVAEQVAEPAVIAEIILEEQEGSEAESQAEETEQKEAAQEGVAAVGKSLLDSNQNVAAEIAVGEMQTILDFMASLGIKMPLLSNLHDNKMPIKVKTEENKELGVEIQQLEPVNIGKSVSGSNSLDEAEIDTPVVDNNTENVETAVEKAENIEAVVEEAENVEEQDVIEVETTEITRLEIEDFVSEALETTETISVISEAKVNEILPEREQFLLLEQERPTVLSFRNPEQIRKDSTVQEVRGISIGKSLTDANFAVEQEAANLQLSPVLAKSLDASALPLETTLAVNPKKEVTILQISPGLAKSLDASALPLETTLAVNPKKKIEQFQVFSENAGKSLGNARRIIFSDRGRNQFSDEFDNSLEESNERSSESRAFGVTHISGDDSTVDLRPPAPRSISPLTSGISDIRGNVDATPAKFLGKTNISGDIKKRTPSVNSGIQRLNNINLANSFTRLTNFPPQNTANLGNFNNFAGPLPTGGLQPTLPRITNSALLGRSRSVIPGPTQAQNLRTLQGFNNHGFGGNFHQFMLLPQNRINNRGRG